MFKESITSYYQREIEVINNLDINEIDSAIQAILEAYRNDAVIYVCGNGGSAATASHYASDFNKGISEKLSKKFKMVSLCDNTPVIMAVANDIAYEEVFRFQLDGRMDKNDLLIAISGSGNSQNVINAALHARRIGARVIGITGYDGGELKRLSDYSMHCNINDMQIAEDIHMTFDHMMYRVFNDYFEAEQKDSEE